MFLMSKKFVEFAKIILIIFQKFPRPGSHVFVCLWELWFYWWWGCICFPPYSRSQTTTSKFGYIVNVDDVVVFLWLMLLLLFISETKLKSLVTICSLTAEILLTLSLVWLWYCVMLFVCVTQLRLNSVDLGVLKYKTILWYIWGIY